MTSYADMQNRIADELGARADLLVPTPGSNTALGPIPAAIQTAIARWERQHFYFNELRQANAFTTAQGQEFYGAATAPVAAALIASLAQLDKATITVSGNRYTLNPRTNQYLEDVSVNPAVLGQPIDYAYFAEQLRLYPIPDNAYPIALLGTERLPPLVNPGDTNSWMTDAEALIRTEAKLDLYENTLHDAAMADRMRRLIHGDPPVPGARGYLFDLKAETARRIPEGGRIRPTYF
jgi:hypothetical protein